MIVAQDNIRARHVKNPILYYQGRPCAQCGSTERRAKNYDCAICHVKHVQAWQRKNRAAQTAWEWAWRHSFHGCISRRYTAMRSRVLGITGKESQKHLWVGLPLLPREQFIDWSKAHPDYTCLHAKWVESCYQRRLTPSIDRINPADGYLIYNMQWVTSGENSRRASMHRWYGVYSA